MVGFLERMRLVRNARNGQKDDVAKTNKPPPTSVVDYSPDSSVSSASSWRNPSTYNGESDRLALLQSLSVLQTDPESRFDSITRLMAAVFETPVALVSLSGDGELWFKSVAGSFGSCIKRKGSFCDMVLVPDYPEVVVLEDMTKDVRFSTHAFVTGAPCLRFYAGAPLIGSTGHRYGTLCVLDVRPRSFPASLLNTLVNFAELVTRELELGWNAPAALKHLGPLIRSSSVFEEPVALVDVSKEGWPLMYRNASWVKAASNWTGSATSSLPPTPEGGNSLRSSTTSTVDNNDQQQPQPQHNQEISFWDVFENDNNTNDVDMAAAVQNLQPITLTVLRKGPLGQLLGQHVEVDLRPSSCDALASNIPVGIPSFVQFQDVIRGSAVGDAANNGPNDNSSNNNSSSSNNAAVSKGSSTNADNLWFAVIRTTGTSASSTTTQSRRSSMDSQRLSSGDINVSLPRAEVASPPPPSRPPKMKAKEEATTKTTTSSSSSSSPTSAAALPKKLHSFGMEVPERYTGIQIGPLLGHGDHTRVHRAVWRGALVAVKIIELPSGPEHCEAISRAIAEGSLSTQLHHPNVVATKDSYWWRCAVQPLHNLPLQETDCVWQVQELCGHGKLSDAVDRGWLKTLPTAAAAAAAPTEEEEAKVNLAFYLRTAADIAGALSYLHSICIVHGNLNYDTVLLASCDADVRGYIAKVCDFGMAQFLNVNNNDNNNDNRLFTSGHYGIVSHMPPELLRDGTISFATDIYSMGVVLWEMWTGVRAWCGQRPEDIAAVVCGSAETNSQVFTMPDDAPEELKRFIARCLSGDVNERPSAAMAWVEIQAMALNYSLSL